MLNRDDRRPGSVSRHRLLRTQPAVAVVAVSFSAALLVAGKARTDPSEPVSGLHDVAASVLAAAIGQVRDDAIESGALPLPAEVRRAFAGYLPEPLLDRVRWRVDAEGLSLPGSVLFFGDKPALTAGHVIVFATPDDASRPLIWAHELYHVSQYSDWGLQGFAARYLADADAVEHAANEFIWRWRDAGGRIEGMP